MKINKKFVTTLICKNVIKLFVTIALLNQVFNTQTGSFINIKYTIIQSWEQAAWGNKGRYPYHMHTKITWKYIWETIRGSLILPNFYSTQHTMLISIQILHTMSTYYQ